MKTVGIIGGSGFIGSHITKKFLREGYNVKVSVTDIKKSEKYQHLFTLENSDNLNLSQLNVENIEVLKDFISDCEIVIHGGTPFQLDFEDAQKELFEPTIKGTENFLEAVLETSSIEKVVLIASVAAYNTNFPLPPDGKNPKDTINERDTPFMSAESHPYAQAKFLANKTVEQFIANHPELSLEITSVSPTAVMGRSLSNREDSTSTGLQFLLKNKIAPNPFIQMLFDTNALFAIVEVKDVAKAIFKVATSKGHHGANFLLSSESFAVSDINLLLNNNNPINKGIMVYDNTLAKKELGIRFTKVAETLANNKIPLHS